MLKQGKDVRDKSTNLAKTTKQKIQVPEASLLLSQPLLHVLDTGLRLPQLVQSEVDVQLQIVGQCTNDKAWCSRNKRKTRYVTLGFPTNMLPQGGDTGRHWYTFYGNRSQKPCPARSIDRSIGGNVDIASKEQCRQPCQQYQQQQHKYERQGFTCWSSSSALFSLTRDTKARMRPRKSLGET